MLRRGPLACGQFLLLAVLLVGCGGGQAADDGRPAAHTGDETYPTTVEPSLVAGTEDLGAESASPEDTEEPSESARREPPYTSEDLCTAVNEMYVAEITLVGGGAISGNEVPENGLVASCFEGPPGGDPGGVSLALWDTSLLHETSDDCPVSEQAPIHGYPAVAASCTMYGMSHAIASVELAGNFKLTLDASQPEEMGPLTIDQATVSLNSIFEYFDDPSLYQ